MVRGETGNQGTARSERRGAKMKDEIEGWLDWPASSNEDIPADLRRIVLGDLDPSKVLERKSVSHRERGRRRSMKRMQKERRRSDRAARQLLSLTWPRLEKRNHQEEGEKSHE